MNRILSGFTALALLSLGLAEAPASATTYFEQEFECPIGGEKFKALVVGSNSSFGQRPDGRPYSPLAVYPVVECPGNGMLLFDEDFSEEELAKLEDVISTDEYKTMRQSDTQHFRVAWLKRQIDRPLISQVNSQLQATWESDGDPERKTRYQAQFVNMTQHLERDEENAQGWFWLNMRAINAMRELGYWEEGLKRLDWMMRDEHLPDDEEERENAQFYAGEIRALLLEENPYFEPANLVPVRIAIFRCAVPQSRLTAVEVAACESEKIATEIAEFEFKPKVGETLRGKEALQAADREWRTKAGGS